MSRPRIVYDRLQDSLSVDWLSEDLVRIELPGGYQLGCGWFGSLEGAGQFEVWINGRSGGELYRRPVGRNPQTVTAAIVLLLEMYSHDTPEAQPCSAAG